MKVTISAFDTARNGRPGANSWTVEIVIDGIAYSAGYFTRLQAIARVLSLSDKFTKLGLEVLT